MEIVQKDGDHEFMRCGFAIVAEEERFSLACPLVPCRVDKRRIWELVYVRDGEEVESSAVSRANTLQKGVDGRRTWLHGRI
jgi:hypothetical protein